MPIPMIRGANFVRAHDLGNYEAHLLDDCQSVGMVTYQFIMPVFRKREERPFMFMTSELNLMASSGGGTHFLCAFSDGKHLNFGASNAWGYRELFEAEALRRLREQFGIGVAPESPGLHTDHESE